MVQGVVASGRQVVKNTGEFNAERTAHERELPVSSWNNACIGHRTHHRLVYILLLFPILLLVRG
jgi:hypothetical protein